MRLRHQIAAILLIATTTQSFSQENDNFDQLVESPTNVIMTSYQPEATQPKKVYPSFLTEKQIELLDQAYEVGLSDNHKNPEILQGILMQETKAGLAEYKSAKNNCFGIFQIKIAAAQDVLYNFPELVLQYGISPTNRKELRNKLIHDDEFNTSIASKYLLILKRYGFDTISQLALAYNQGPGGGKYHNPNTFGYSASVVKHIKKLK